MTPKVSVIVPVYKAEAYLHRCIDSLLIQSIQDFEILLIDDGSPDKSGKICDEYALKDKRIRIIHKENGGVSSARQCGIENALGEYTIHADPDDWVDSNMLEELYTKAKEDNADMVICDFFEEKDNKQIYHKQKPSKLDKQTVLKELFQQLHGSCCNKLIRRACYNKANVSFDLTLSFCEDLYYHASLLLSNITITYLPKAFYHYDQTINNNSIVRKYTHKTFEYDIMLYNKFCNLLKNTDAYKYAEANMGYMLVYRAFFANLYTSKEFKEHFSLYKHSILRKYKILNFHDRYSFFLYYSCLGYYQLMYRAYFTLKRILNN